MAATTPASPSSADPLPLPSTEASTTVDTPQPPKKTCQIKDVLPAGVIPLIAANPRNDTIRNLMLAHLKQPVPVECDTFDKVKEWIEHNVAFEKPEDPLERQYRLAQEAEERRIRNSIQVAVYISGSETGRCNYNRDVAGQGNVPLLREKIIEIAAEAGEPVDFFRGILELIEEIGPTNYVSYDIVEDTEHFSEYDIDYDGFGLEAEISEAGKEALKAALRAADQELYRSLFGE